MTKTNYEMLLTLFPDTALQFSTWAQEQYRVYMKLWDGASSVHRYIIAARFFGEALEPDPDTSAEDLERKIFYFFERFDKALKLYGNKDPLLALTDMPWEKRNQLTEMTWVRKTRDGIRDSLKHISKPSGENSIRTCLMDYLPVQDQIVQISSKENTFWEDLIPISWQFQKEKIIIPF